MKPIDPINYISLDLEFNTIELRTTNIIQVGVSIGNYIEGIKETKSWFVDPGEPLSEHIISLTGITEGDIKNATDIKEIAWELGALINEYSCFVNPVQWGFNDAECLKNLFKKHKINFPYFGRQNIDVKQLFSFIEITNGRSIKAGLQNAMNKFKIKFEGHSHTADIDAKNTLKFFFELLRRQRIIEESIYSIKNLKV